MTGADNVTVKGIIQALESERRRVERMRAQYNSEVRIAAMRAGRDMADAADFNRVSVLRAEQLLLRSAAAGLGQAIDALIEVNR